MNVATVSTYRRSDIQGLRAVAVLMVVTYHAGLPLPGGFTGVDVFFVISGFVITSLLQREFAATGTVKLGQFFMRRFRRLAPALALVTTLTLLASILVLSPLGPLQNAIKTAVGASLWIANVVIAVTTGGYFDDSADKNPLLHTWSLSVEEQFYLVFPVLLTTAWAIGQRRSKSLSLGRGAVLIAGTLSFAFAMAGAMELWLPGVRPELMGFYSPVTRGWEFAAGAGLALWMADSDDQRRSFGAWASWVGAFALMASAILINDSMNFPGLVTLIPVLGTLLLLASNNRVQSWPASGLNSDFAAKIGDWSYSIYLWHWPVLSLTRRVLPDASTSVMVVAAMASFLPAYLSYRYLENPLRHSQPTRSARWRLALLTLSIPLASAAFIAYALSQGFWNQQVRTTVLTVTTPHVATSAGCDTAFPPQDRAPGDCVWNSEASGPPIYLIGDSHAGHLSEATIGAARELQRQVTILTSNACPVLGVAVFAPSLGSRWNAQCNHYLVKTIEWLEAAPGGTVILANASGYLQQGGYALGPDVANLSSESSLKLHSVEAGLSNLIKSLKHSGHKVVLVQDSPRSPIDPATCTLLQLADHGCERLTGRSDALSAQLTERDLVHRAALEHQTLLFDVPKYLCRNGLCRATLHGTLLFRDVGHLSVAGSRFLTPWLAALLSNS